MDLTRKILTSEVDPQALARAYGISLQQIALRLGVTAEWARRLVRDSKHGPRVRRAILEIALEQEVVN